MPFLLNFVFNKLLKYPLKMKLKILFNFKIVKIIILKFSVSITLTRYGYEAWWGGFVLFFFLLLPQRPHYNAKRKKPHRIAERKKPHGKERQTALQIAKLWC